MRRENRGEGAKGRCLFKKVAEKYGTYQVELYQQVGCVLRNHYGHSNSITLYLGHLKFKFIPFSPFNLFHVFSNSNYIFLCIVSNQFKQQTNLKQNEKLVNLFDTNNFTLVHIFFWIVPTFIKFLFAYMSYRILCEKSMIVS